MQVVLSGRLGVGLCLLALLTFAACTKQPPSQVACCASWSVVNDAEHLVIRAKVQEKGTAMERRIGEGSEKYKVTPFSLVITDVLKPSIRQEQEGDQIQLWVSGESEMGTPILDRIGGLLGQEAVFLLAVTEEGGYYPSGYTLYSGDSYWVITGDRVSGGSGALELKDALYSELVRNVEAALQEGK